MYRQVGLTSHPFPCADTQQVVMINCSTSLQSWTGNESQLKSSQAVFFIHYNNHKSQVFMMYSWGIPAWVCNNSSKLQYALSLSSPLLLGLQRSMAKWVEIDHMLLWIMKSFLLLQIVLLGWRLRWDWNIFGITVSHRGKTRGVWSQHCSKIMLNLLTWPIVFPFWLPTLMLVIYL